MSADVLNLVGELPPVTDVQDDYIDDDVSNDNSDIGENPIGDNAENIGENPQSNSNLEYDGLFDDKGRAFDSDIHTTPPEKTPSGIWKKKKKSERVPLYDGQESISNALEAQKYAQIYANLHTIPFGLDGLPDNPAELLPLVNSLEKLFNEIGVVELPVWFDVALSGGLYTQNICVKETNIEKTKKFFKNTFQKIKNLFGK